MNKFIKVLTLLIFASLAINQSEVLGVTQSYDKPGFFHGLKKFVGTVSNNIFLRDLVKKVDLFKKHVQEMITQQSFKINNNEKFVAKMIEQINGMIDKYGDKALKRNFCHLPKISSIDAEVARKLLSALNAMGKEPCISSKNIDEAIESLKKSVALLTADKRGNPLLMRYNKTDSALLGNEIGKSINNNIRIINEWIEKNPDAAKTNRYCSLPEPNKGKNNELIIDGMSIKALKRLIEEMRSGACSSNKGDKLTVDPSNTGKIK